MIGKKGYIKTKGVNMYFESKGTGESILFIHAGIADCRMWEREYQTLAKYYHVIRLDLPGFGLSSFTGGVFSFTDAIEELFKHLNVNNVHIVAASFGGKIAMDYILKNEEKCLSTVLISPALSGWEESQYLQDYEAEEMRLYENGLLEEVALLNYKTWILRKRSQESIDSNIKDLVMDMQLRALSKPEPDIEPEEIEEEVQINRLMNIKIPVTIVSGEEDVPDFLHISELLINEIHNSRRVLIPGTSHLPNLEVPEVFEKILLEALRNQSNE